MRIPRIEQRQLSEEQKEIITKIWDEWNKHKKRPRLTWVELAKLCFCYYDLCRETKLSGKIIPFHLALDKKASYAGNLESITELFIKQVEGNDEG